MICLPAWELPHLFAKGDVYPMTTSSEPTRRGSEIPGQLIVDVCDIEMTLSSIGRLDYDATALIVSVGDGDYDAVWATDDARPYRTAVRFERLV
jgi:hypothetical protein